MLRVEASQDIPVPFEQSFEEFFELEHERLLRALYLMTGHLQESEDIMQDAFVKVLERWNAVQSMDDPTGYLYRTAMNTFRSRYRRAVMAMRRVALLTPQSRNPFEEVDVREDVRQALTQLPQRQRAALVLTELLGYGAADAGAMLSIKPSTVRALATQARGALRSRMRPSHE